MMIHVLTNYAVSKRIYLHLSKLGEYLKKSSQQTTGLSSIYSFCLFFYVFSLIV